MGANTLRALASDLGYLETWCQLSLSSPCPGRRRRACFVLVAHHLWDPVERAEDPSHGMPADVAAGLRARDLLRVDGPHAPDTVRRRLTSWSILTRWRGLGGAFGAPPEDRVAARGEGQQTAAAAQEQKAVTGDVLAKLLAACAGDRLVDLRDRALLLLAFASGGRRRSEVAGLRVEDVIDDEPVRADPANAHSSSPPCLTIHLGRTKTTTADDDEQVVLIGRPVTALKHWLAMAQIEAGPVFRRIDQWGNIDRQALTPQSVNLILKARVKQAGLDPTAFSAHGLRSGYLTEAANRGVPLPEAMQQSLHKSVTQAASYYNNAERKMGRAARLVI